MGLRFRKSMKLGPLRINFSKSGIGYSYGVKGFRVTHKANGGVRTTASIPGTGVSYVKDYPSSAVQKTAEPSPSGLKRSGRTATITSKGVTRTVHYVLCPRCGHEMLESSTACPHCGYKTGASIAKTKKSKKPIAIGAAAVLAGVIGLSALGGGNDPAPAPVPTPAPSVVTPVTPTVKEPEPAPVEPAPAPDPEPAPVAPAPVPDPEPAPTPVTTPEPAPNPEPVPVAPAPAPEPGKPAEETVVKDERVYIGNIKSKIFHYDSCSSVKKMNPENKVKITGRDTAIGKGYDPCGNCHP